MKNSSIILSLLIYFTHISFLLSQKINEVINGVYVFSIETSENKMTIAGFLSIEDTSFYFESNDYYSDKFIRTSKLPEFLQKKNNNGPCKFFRLYGKDETMDISQVPDNTIIGFIHFGSNNNISKDISNILVVKTDKPSKHILLSFIHDEEQNWELSKPWQKNSLSRQKAFHICDSIFNNILREFPEKSKKNYLWELKQDYCEGDICWICYYQYKENTTTIKFPNFFRIKVYPIFRKVEILKE